MQEGTSGRSQRKLRLRYLYPSPCAVNSLFQTIKLRLWHLVHFLCAAQII